MKFRESDEDPILLERILSRITRVDHGYKTPCWIPNIKPGKDGYCRLRFGGRDSKRPVMHKLALLLIGVEIPPLWQVDHLCRVRSCCRPSHLETVTASENTARMWAARKTFPD